MRIALIIERFEPAAGGVENAAWQAAHGLARAGDEVHVVTRRARPTAAVRLIRVDGPSGWQPVRVLAFLRAAARRAPRGAFDVVHSFCRTLHQDVYRAGGGSHADYMERQYAPLGRAARRLSPRHVLNLEIERRVFADATQLVQCNSRLVQRQIAERHRVSLSRLVVIRNGVDLDGFHPERAASAGAALRAAHCAGDRLIWLLVGSGFRRKGLDIALRALAVGGPRQAELWVAGRGATRAFQRLAERLGVAARVRFLGPQQDLRALYGAATALLLPTRYDAFANVCLEAAAAGTPVITSGANGAAELFRNAGVVVEDPEDVGGFAAALDELAEPKRRRELGEAARRVAETRSWDAHVSELRALYRRIRPLGAPAGAEP